ncbi:hypothetical protein [Bradyrhizobium sp.]|uniref:hypothetical protein n=1 Tax=Bradyrhizobium sp. TaxID=376 RepID=UPI002DFC0634|nr:hypothetical protein [Bradyrhizobium sp.]
MAEPVARSGVGDVPTVKGIQDMSVTKEEKTVTVEKRSGSSDANATVTENGKSGSAKGGSAREALERAKDKAKG